MPFDCFCKIETIEGESTDDKHGKWIEILSYSHGVSQPQSGASVSSAGGTGGGRTDHDNFTVVKQLDKASPKLSKACSAGENVGKVEIELCRATGDKQPYMKYTLEKAYVTSVRPGGSSQGGDVPLEEVSFAYQEICWKYTETSDDKPGGNVETKWSLKTNKGG